ncbi:MAG: hypothetical protein KGI94_12075 [Paracoccaceae bacterium]|nr:hypothetical protein [Paracoccaceae bacterium]MDE3121444.1 hypothetical protein [Paracoccaceae bacterium]MDE3239364.1 hypothetical protein [Paracoccaceae bacterium]
MQDTPSEEDRITLDPTVRFLKILVTTLTVTMIVGLITVVAVFVIRFPGKDDSDLKIPPDITLPAGEHPTAVTQGRGWIAIVTQTGKILVFDGDTGALRHSYAIGN